MSLDACIPGLVASGKLTTEQGAEAAAIYGRRKRHHARSMSDPAAAAAASEDAARALEIAAEQRAFQAMLQIETQKRIIADMAVYRGEQPGDAAIAVIVRDDRAPYANFEYRWKSVRGEAHALMEALLQKHRRNIVGEVPAKADLIDLVRERFGQKTNNLSAREMAEAFGLAAEMLRRRFNAAGGHIGKLDGWGLPTKHDSVSISEAGQAAWLTDARRLFDRDRMIDHATGQRFDDESWEGFLRDLYATVASNGWADRVPGGVGKGKLANQRAEHRVIHFRDADAWLEYHQKYGGNTSPFDVMMSHIDGMSRDIAMLEILGPNPAATVKWMTDALDARASLQGGRGGKRKLFGLGSRRLTIDQARMDSNVVQRVFDEAAGKHRDPHNRELALAFSALRSWQVTTKLGSAALSTTSDAAAGALTRAMNGLPVAGMMASYARMLNPFDKADRAFAIRSGLIAEEYAQTNATATARYLGEELTGEVARRMADGVVRLSGLSQITQGGRWAYGRDQLNFWTYHAERGTAFGALSPGQQRMFQRYGLGEREWDMIRQAPRERHAGTEWVQPLNIADQRVRSRVMEMILAETDMAVPTPGLRIRAAMNVHAKQGTWTGELLRTGLQFKAFPIAYMHMQWTRAMALGGSNAALYLAAFLTLSMMAGAWTLDMKDVSRGRDPRSKRDWEYWGEALVQGGGLGIYGDFIRSSESRTGSGIQKTLLGPAVQTGATIEALTVDPLRAAARGEEYNLGRQAARALRSETPGGTLWYSRLAFERLWIDQLQSWADPNYRQSWARMERQAEERGQEYFWSPGAPEPERAPDLGAMIAEGRE
jgi:hypothetical protein